MTAIKPTAILFGRSDQTFRRQLEQMLQDHNYEIGKQSRYQDVHNALTFREPGDTIYIAYGNTSIPGDQKECLEGAHERGIPAVYVTPCVGDEKPGISTGAEGNPKAVSLRYRDGDEQKWNQLLEAIEVAKQHAVKRSAASSVTPSIGGGPSR